VDVIFASARDLAKQVRARQVSAREVMNMCELRLTLEAAALRLAFERDRKGLLEGLKGTVAVMERARAAHDMRA
jgi:DNA-binding GntR family transcriptional regulator